MRITPDVEYGYRFFAKWSYIYDDTIIARLSEYI